MRYGGDRARCERRALTARRIEVGRIQPPAILGFERRPFAVDDRIPGGVAGALFVDGGLAEQAFVVEAEPFGGGAWSLANPLLMAAIYTLAFEYIVRIQVPRLASQRLPL